MLLMIILIALSISFLIGAIIYSNYKKKNYNTKLAKQGLSSNKRKSNKNLSNILDIQIKDCFIKVGNRYSSV